MSSWQQSAAFSNKQLLSKGWTRWNHSLDSHIISYGRAIRRMCPPLPPLRIWGYALCHQMEPSLFETSTVAFGKTGQRAERASVIGYWVVGGVSISVNPGFAASYIQQLGRCAFMSRQQDIAPNANSSCMPKALSGLNIDSMTSSVQDIS